MKAGTGKEAKATVYCHGEQAPFPAGDVRADDDDHPGRRRLFLLLRRRPRHGGQGSPSCWYAQLLTGY